MRANIFELKQTIIEIGRRLWERGFVASNDGNITVKFSENELLTTPTGVSKGFMTPEMIIRVDGTGKPLEPNARYRPSSEVKMHLKVYQQRSDIFSIIHTHPPYCTSFAVAGIHLDKCVLPEAILTLGAVPIAPYGTPSTMEIPDAIEPYITKCDAVLLANHGALTLGTDLMAAYHRMETLEHSARIVFLSIQLGNVNVIPPAQVSKLMDVRSAMKMPGRIMTCAPDCQTDQKQAPDDLVDKITKIVTEKLKSG